MLQISQSQLYLSWYDSFLYLQITKKISITYTSFSHTVSSVIKHSVCYIIKKASVYLSNLPYLCFYISKLTHLRTYIRCVCFNKSITNMLSFLLAFSQELPYNSSIPICYIHQHHSLTALNIPHAKAVHLNQGCLWCYNLYRASTSFCRQHPHISP